MQIVYSKKKKKKVNCVALIYSSFFLKMREREREVDSCLNYLCRDQSVAPTNQTQLVFVNLVYV